jgi:hypothetical protein
VTLWTKNALITLLPLIHFGQFFFATIRAKKLCLEKKTVIGHAISAISQDKGLKIQTEA